VHVFRASGQTVLRARGKQPRPLPLTGWTEVDRKQLWRRNAPGIPVIPSRRR
jgi:hypothetical protein